MSPADAHEPAKPLAAPGEAAAEAPKEAPGDAAAYTAGATSGPESGRDTAARTAEDPDRRDVQASVAGDPRAFEALVRRHQDAVFTRIYFMVRDRALAEDLAQEAFLKAYRSLGGFRGEALFATWLGRIAVNVTMHHFERERALKRAGKVVSLNATDARSGRAPAVEIADRTHDPEARALRNERQQAILDAVLGLDVEYRLALTLREFHGFSYQEIGDQLGLPIGTVKSKIFRARQILQQTLKDIL